MSRAEALRMVNADKPSPRSGPRPPTSPDPERRDPIVCASALETIVSKHPLTREELLLLEECFERIRLLPTADGGVIAPPLQSRLPGLARKVAVVSGAAQGIGQAIAVSLAQQGATVVCCDLASNPATATVEIIQSSGGKAVSMACDVTDRAAIDAVMEDAVASFHRLDICVSVVGGGERKPFLDQTHESYTQCIELSQHSHWHFQQSAARQMVALKQEMASLRQEGLEQGSGGGTLVLIGSIMQTMSIENVSAYQIAKSALPTLTKCIANELAPHGIRANLVQPGYIDTPGELRWATREAMLETAGKIPLQRMGQGSDIGDAVAFLCSDLVSRTQF